MSTVSINARSLPFSRSGNLFRGCEGAWVMPKPQRVVITGLGVVAPNGVGKEAFWQALIKGLSGVRTIRRFDTSRFPSRIGGEIVDFDPLRYFEPQELKKVDR